ncbi:MAG: hypothetical protein N2C14_16110, partial [Planctomycetales bacterium]
LWAAARCGVDRLLACGEFAEHIADGAVEAGLSHERIWTGQDALDGENALRGWLRPNDVLLLKGSRATRMERIIDRLRSQAVRQIA